MLALENVRLRSANRKDFHQLWYYIYIEQAWKQYDAPFYLFDYKSKLRFYFDLYQRLKRGKTAKVIEYNGELVGYLTYYWEDEHTRWLDVGITLFTPHHWGKQIGRKALWLWVSYVFEQVSPLARIGLTTWSGNPRMMKCAERIGMKREGHVRNVRYFNGQYYDCVIYGMLREEWQKMRFERPLVQKQNQQAKTHDACYHQATSP